MSCGGFDPVSLFIAVQRLAEKAPRKEDAARRSVTPRLRAGLTSTAPTALILVERAQSRQKKECS